jgi:two-component system chemotaxis sensor kinase CheA
MLADDPALLTAFLDESQESLDGLETGLIDLDQAQDHRAQIDAIFRPVHTLKGNAPFFGFMQVQRLAHALETVLDHLRKDHLDCTPAVIDGLLAGLDGLRACIARIRAGGAEVVETARFAALVDRLAALAQGPSHADPWRRVAADLAVLARHEDQFEPELRAIVIRMRQDVAVLTGGAEVNAPHGPADPAFAIRRRLAQPVTSVLDAVTAEAVIADLRALRAACRDSAHGKILDDTIATCQTFTDSVGFDDMVRQHVLDHLDQIAPIEPSPTDVGTSRRSSSEVALEPITTATATTTGDVDRTATRTGSSNERRPRQTGSGGHAKSMRVSEAAVDGFLAYVGELLVIGDQLDYLQRRLTATSLDQPVARDMHQAVASFGALSSELQRSIMAVRRVPVRTLLQKAPRLARDIAQAAGKDIAVELAGETTEVDKSRLDLLDAPLTHLVRNCADHGIERPERRTAAGKPARGTIRITASSDAGWFLLDIADDGAGLDLAAIRRKGEALGMIAPGVPLDERDIIDLIFASGLSTAATISDVSGRGVGMDVVKRQIQDAGGCISVTTVAGQGTTFRLRLPSAVTTQIVSAFLVRDGGGVFALPLDLVRESFAAADTANAHGRDGSSVVLRHGTLLPVAPLGRILGQTTAPPPTTDQRRTIVTVERNGRLQGLSVDATLGVRRLVIRPLKGIVDGDLDGRFRGAALLGDGQLALVVDPERLHHVPG